MVLEWMRMPYGGTSHISSLAPGRQPAHSHSDSSPSTTLDLSVTHTLLEVILPLVAEAVKNLPEMQETRVQSLCQEDPLEKGMETHSSILAWRIPWTEEPGGIQSKCGWYLSARSAPGSLPLHRRDSSSSALKCPWGRLALPESLLGHALVFAKAWCRRSDSTCLLCCCRLF